MDLLWIDYGTRKTGLAYSISGICFTGEIVATDAYLLQRIIEIIEKKSLKKVIVGIAKHANGTLSDHGKITLEWIKGDLKKWLPESFIVETWSEYGTSSDARFLAAEESIHSYQKNTPRDSEAARLILEDYLTCHE